MDHDNEGQQLLVKETLAHPDDTIGGALQLRSTDGGLEVPGCRTTVMIEEAGRKEQSLPTFDLQ